MLKNSLLQPSFFLSASAPLFSSFFCFSFFLFQRSPLCFFFFLPFFSFQFTCALFFNPKTFFSAQNNSLFRPKKFFSAQTFFSFFQPNRFCFSPKPFSVQPTPLFQPLFVLFQPFFFFVGSVFSAPFSCLILFFFSFFLFQCLILFFLPTSKAKNILFRCFTFLLFE